LMEEFLTYLLQDKRIFNDMPDELGLTWQQVRNVYFTRDELQELLHGF